jgi:hypothetical protein
MSAMLKPSYGIRYMPWTFDVQQLVAQLAAHPELWNDFDLRTNHPQSPHRELDDIFVRYNARENFTGDRHAFNEPHTSVWWPAAEVLPAAVDIANALLLRTRGDELGMVLITRIPAGKTCYPHTDHGWHARHFEKYAVQIASAKGQAFHVENVSLEAKPGECYWFDNARSHWVTNESAEDRITLIACIRSGEPSCQ